MGRKWLRVKGHNILSDDSDDSEDSPSYEFVPRSSSYIDISKSEDSFPTNQEKESWKTEPCYRISKSQSVSKGFQSALPTREVKYKGKALIELSKRKVKSQSPSYSCKIPSWFTPKSNKSHSLRVEVLPNKTLHKLGLSMEFPLLSIKVNPLGTPSFAHRFLWLWTLFDSPTFFLTDVYSPLNGVLHVPTVLFLRWKFTASTFPWGKD